MNKKVRRPAAFTIKDPAPDGTDAARKPMRQEKRAPVAVSDVIEFATETDDPFSGAQAAGQLSAEDKALADQLTPPPAQKSQSTLSLGKIAASAFGLLLSLAFALWLDSLITSFFARSEWFGWVATGLATIAVGALAGLVIREARALSRLKSVHQMREAALQASIEKNPAKARLVLSKLIRMFSHDPQTARPRARLKQLDGEIIDGPHLMELAEVELMAALDIRARELILNASKRVSVVTALSPRALIDIGYVLYEAMRLIRNLAKLYGGRPGSLGALRLARDVVSHLAVTGSISLGDGVIQQLLGHGLASKISARLGEGVINGMMTARVGIAAMDLCRPLPFKALKRPGLGEFAGDLTRQATGSKKKQA